MTLYKPNNSGSGHGLGLRFNAKESVFFLSIIKQNGFNENGKGKFNGGKECVAALGLHEIGGLLGIIEVLKAPIIANEKATLIPTRREHKYHHESAKQSLQIKFAPYVDTATQIVKGLSISVVQTMKEGGEKTSFSFWAGLDEIYVLENFAKFGLERCFLVELAEDAARARDHQARQAQNTENA